MPVIGLRMPAGMPGAVSRIEQLHAEPVHLDPAAPFSAFGLPGVVGANGRFRPVQAGDTAASVSGFLIRTYPGLPSSTYYGVTGMPTGSVVADRMRRGYMQVKINAGNATKESPVFVRVGAGTVAKPVGGLEAAADGANTIQLTACTFMGPADSEGNTEIAFNI